VRTNASHTAFSAKPWNGRFLIQCPLPQRMRSSTRRMATVASFEICDVGVVLVGDEDLKAIIR